jgi:hypothetical protein
MAGGSPPPAAAAVFQSFLAGGGAVLLGVEPKGTTGPAGFFGCFGFFFSLLLRR